MGGSELNGEYLSPTTKVTIVILSIYAISRTILSHFTDVSIIFLTWFSSVEFLILGIYAIVMLYRARSCFDPGTMNHKMMSFFGYGFIIWAIGNFVLVVETLILDEPPMPTFSDIFYIAGYFPIIFIMIYRTRSILVPPERKRLIIVSLIFLIFTIISFTYVIIPIVNSDEGVIVRVVAITYPILDIVLMGSALTLFPKYAGGKLEKVWFLVSLCIIANAISDLVLTYQSWHNSYDARSWGNDFVIYTYLLVIVFASYLRDLFGTN